ncbi:MAG: hypothetical protein IPL28_07335 [Chloroflexi bacterium]|nr:hypothetical protein [Chloroflexota bacterium]
MLDGAGNLIAQQDSQPWDGRYPTTLWQVGELVAETKTIPLPAVTSSDRLAIGAYVLGGGRC